MLTSGNSLIQLPSRMWREARLHAYGVGAVPQSHGPKADQADQRAHRGCDGYEGIGKPEPLRGELSGFWSRRIDREHRLVYRIKGKDVEIIACRYHYSNM
jgi:hypothetical protein